MRARLTNIEGAGRVQRPRASVEPVEPMARVGSSAEPRVERQAAPQNTPVKQPSVVVVPLPAPKLPAPVLPAPSFDDDEWEW